LRLVLRANYRKCSVGEQIDAFLAWWVLCIPGLGRPQTKRGRSFVKRVPLRDEEFDQRLGANV